MSHNDDADRRPPHPRQQQREIEPLAHPARQLEVGLDVNVGKSVLIAQDQIRVIDAELLGVPVLDQAIEHVEVVRKVDDARRIAMGKPDRHRARERAGRRNEAILFQSAHLTIGLCKYWPFAGFESPTPEKSRRLSRWDVQFRQNIATRLLPSRLRLVTA